MTPGRQLAPRPDIWGCLKKSPPISALTFTFSEDLKLDFRALRQLRNREAEIEASIMGGKLYLAAYAQRLGAPGSHSSTMTSRTFSPRTPQARASCF